MKPVLCFGEALIDFLNTGTLADGELSLNAFTQFPGGAPANAAVAVARLGGNALFAGQVGQDPFGEFLLHALNTYGVDTRFTAQHPSAKTALAFVFLDQQGERSFSFHREQSADLLFDKHQVDDAWFDNHALIHFCSNTLTETAIADVTRHIVSQAKLQHSLISFDVNLRHNLWTTGQADRALVNAFVHQADLVKFTKEEFEYLSESNPGEDGLCEGQQNSYLRDCFAAGVKAVLVTDGGGTVALYTQQTSRFIEPPKITPIDTTGGGDAFIGAVLFGLSQVSESLAFLKDAQQLQSLVAFATHCGAVAVSRKGAFPALPRFSDVEKFWGQDFLPVKTMHPNIE